MNFLTVDQVALKLQVSRNTIVKLIKKEEINALKVGKQYRIPKEQFNQFLSESKVISNQTRMNLTEPERVKNKRNK